MTEPSAYSEISILIPGYSIEDLPTDLPEDDAASLLNAIACAWHPSLLQLSNSIPVFRQADSLTDFPGQRIVLVPVPSESWMPHAWREAFRTQGHIVLASCSKREDWLDAIDLALTETETNGGARADGDQTTKALVPDPEPIGLKQCSDAESSETTNTASLPVLADHFLALGIVKLQVQLLSRRRHHFVDTDNILLSREACLAAHASIIGDEASVRLHLARCFEHLRDIREQFYPMNCYLLDVCIPGDDVQTSEITSLISAATPATRLNLFATGHDLASWTEKDASLSAQLKQAVSEGTLTLLTGHSAETRTSLGSMAATLTDIDRCRTTYAEILGSPPRHWARRRFGMTASLPSLLAYFGFESALHFALDDGLYPDKEYSQFDWQAPDGSRIPAASRIPLAIDSASGFLRLADRYNESMQDDHTAALFLARLPVLKAPWLKDLQIAANYAPVLGEFASIDALVHISDGDRTTERYQHAEYLSPYLIQSAVLKTESPVSGPALLRLFQQRLESLRTLFSMTRLIKAEADATSINTEFAQIETELETLELQHVDIAKTLSEKDASLKSASTALENRLNACSDHLILILRSKIPHRHADAQSLLITNTVPFARMVDFTWPATWKRPAAASAIELAERTNNIERLLIKTPPGGFVWLTETGPGQTPQPVLESIPREPPLAEILTLRNRHFEVTLSDRTGGFASVMYHQQRGNRLSQQICFRYERDQTLPADGTGEVRKTTYATAQLIDHRILQAGTVFASIETTVELQSPVDGSSLAVVRQITSVDRARPRIHIQLIFDKLVTQVKGNPWLTYFGCRFAWDNESASVTRSVMGHAAGFRSDRFESPDYVEIGDADHRCVIATHGRPYHRMSGTRMFDSLLIVESEPAREFEFTIDFDQPFPLRTAVDAMTPPIVTQMPNTIPNSITSSWILGLSARNVELLHSEVRPATDDASEELSLYLTETEGVVTRCLIRTARLVTAAFDVNADRSRKVALEITDQGVVVPLSVFQFKEVLLTLQESR